jgi:hypothetical protein
VKKKMAAKDKPYTERLLRSSRIYGKNLHDQDLTGLAELCGNVARHSSADYRQSQTAHALRVEWLRLNLGSLNGDRTEAEKSLKKRMEEFLAGVPSWMLRGL